MGRIYDNWERLVEVVMRREQLRTLSLSDSLRSFDSDLSFSSSSNWRDSLSFSENPSPLHPDAVKLKLAKSVNSEKQVPPKRRNAMWKGLSIFGGFSSKKDYGREEREIKWAKDWKTLHGLEPMKTGDGKVFPSAEDAKEAKRRAEIARLQELHTLKGHIASLVKAKGLDINSIHHSYTI